MSTRSGQVFRTPHKAPFDNSARPDENTEDAAAADDLRLRDEDSERNGHVTMSMDNLSILLQSIQQSNADMFQRLLHEVRASTPAAAEPANVTVVAPTAPVVTGNFSKCQATYSGSVEESLEGFIDAVEAYKDCCNVSDENAIRGFSILLTHSAATWWQGIKSTTATWTDALDRLRRAFGDRRPPHRLYRDLFENEQQFDENTDQFVARARAIFSRLPVEDLTERAKLDMVYGLLHHRIRERLRREEFKSFDELLSKAHSIEDSFKVIGTSSGSNSSWKPRDLAPPPTSNAPPTARAPRPASLSLRASSSPPRSTVGTSTSMADSNNKKRMFCAYCRKSNHFKDSCPKLSSKNNNITDTVLENNTSNIHCYGCGEKGVVRSNCSKCNLQFSTIDFEVTCNVKSSSMTPPPAPGSAVVERREFHVDRDDTLESRHSRILRVSKPIELLDSVNNDRNFKYGCETRFDYNLSMFKSVIPEFFDTRKSHVAQTIADFLPKQFENVLPTTYFEVCVKSVAPLPYHEMCVKPAVSQPYHEICVKPAVRKEMCVNRNNCRKIIKGSETMFDYNLSMFKLVMPEFFDACKNVARSNFVFSPKQFKNVLPTAFYEMCVTPVAPLPYHEMCVKPAVSQPYHKVCVRPVGPHEVCVKLVGLEPCDMCMASVVPHTESNNFSLDEYTLPTCDTWGINSYDDADSRGSAFKANQTEDLYVSPIIRLTSSEVDDVPASNPFAGSVNASLSSDFASADLCSSQPLSLVQQRPILGIAISGFRGTALIDTGAKRSVIGCRLFGLLSKNNQTFQECGMSIRFADGSVQNKMVLTTMLEVAVKHKTVSLEFVALPDAAGNDTLLGIDFLVKAGISMDFAAAKWHFSKEKAVLYPIEFESPNQQVICSSADMLRDDEGIMLQLWQRNKSGRFLQLNEDIFKAGGALTTFAEYHINMGDHSPISSPPFCLTPAKKEIMKELDELLIEECESAWTAPAILVSRKGKGVMLAMNDAISASIGCTPLILMFAFENQTDLRSILSKENFIGKVVVIRVRVEGTQDRPGLQGKVGYLVLVNCTALSNASKGTTKKFMPKRDGPYRFSEQVSSTTFQVSHVDDGTRVGKFHASYLTPFVARQGKTSQPVQPRRRRGRPPKVNNVNTADAKPHTGRSCSLEGEDVAREVSFTTPIHITYITSPSSGDPESEAAPAPATPTSSQFTTTLKASGFKAGGKFTYVTLSIFNILLDAIYRSPTEEEEFPTSAARGRGVPRSLYHPRRQRHTHY